MINHARTLLINALSAADYSLPGEEFISNGFRPLPLPTYLQTLRERLFGKAPDRHMLNYRAQQFMQLLHATELREFVVGLDRRITYEPTKSNIFTHDYDVAVVKQYTGSHQITLSIGGDYAPAGDASGIVHYQWDVAAISDSQVAVRLCTRPKGYAITNYTVTNSLGDVVPLLGSSLNFRFSANLGTALGWLEFTETDWSTFTLDDWVAMNMEEQIGVGNSGWIVETDIRPKTDMGQLTAELDRLGEPTFVQLFGIGDPVGEEEPFRTFRNLWYRHKELPYRLGAVLLAMIYQTDRIRAPR